METPKSPRAWLRTSVLLAGLSFSGFMQGCDDGSPMSSGLDKNDTASISYLALGDSYTIGEGVAEQDRWPMQLSAKARASGIRLSDPVIIARTGWTTGELASGMDAANPQGPYGLVTLLIGVNNQYRGMLLEDYRIEFKALLERAIALAGDKPDRVMVVSIPDWGASFYGMNYDPVVIAREIDAFNAANREEATLHGTRYADVTGVSRTAAGDESMFAADGLHPSASMYKAWVAVAAAALAGLPATDALR